MTRTLIVLLAAATSLSLTGCGRTDTLRIATTTSVDNSGLLEALVPVFEDQHHVNLQVIAVGSGQAFQLGRRGDVALLLTHEPRGERALFDDGLIRVYRKVMFNRFVIAGPPADPAGLEGAASAADAMARIARSGQPFVSRGDESGTHVRERDLWAAARLAPQPSRLIETGQGMAPTLRVASERQAYVLTDEATLARLAGALSLRVVFEGGDALINTYAVAILTTAPAASFTMAEQLAQWLIEGGGRSRIDAFRIAGRQVFFVWPQGAAGGSPESMPPGVFTP